jgi:hypothetical protein
MDKPEMTRLLDELTECQRRRDAVYSAELSQKLKHPDAFNDLPAEDQERWRAMDEQCRRIEARIARLSQSG